MKKLFTLLVLFLSITIFSEKILIRLYDVKEIKSNWDIASIGKNYVDIVIGKNELSKYTDRFTKVEQLRTNSDLTGYLTYDEIKSRMNMIVNSYPHMINMTDVGDSYEKTKLLENPTYNSNYHYHDILCLKISNNIDTEDLNKRNLLVMAAHHARELETSEMLILEMEKMLEEYSANDADIKNLLDNYVIYFIPMVNPDGYSIVLDSDNMWRKNDHDNNGDHSYADYSDGVDPNRNYDWHWGDPDSHPDFNVTSEVYPGKYAFSEPETEAIRDLAQDIHPIGSISYHSYGQLVLFPFSYYYVEAPDNNRLFEIANNIGNSIGGYTGEQSVILYPASGDSDDYLYGELGTFSYTVEVGTQFHPLHSDIPNLAEKNYNGLKRFFRELISNHIKGRVYDSETLEPLEGITYNILQLDNYGLTNERNTDKEGHYYWNLPNGTYTILLSHKGYNLKAVSFNINNSFLNKDIYMERSYNSSNVFMPIFPNPSLNSNVFLGINCEKGYEMECSIFSISGRKLYTFPKKISEGFLSRDSYIIPISFDNGISLSSGTYIVNVKIAKENVLLFDRNIKFALIH
ncbi:hypothetical protein J7L48_05190 [bacterium]|nr:hypothetical protein [bacterium]